MVHGGGTTRRRDFTDHFFAHGVLFIFGMGTVDSIWGCYFLHLANLRSYLLSRYKRHVVLASPTFVRGDAYRGFNLGIIPRFSRHRSLYVGQQWVVVFSVVAPRVDAVGVWVTTFFPTITGTRVVVVTMDGAELGGELFRLLVSRLGFLSVFICTNLGGTLYHFTILRFSG